MGPPTVSIIIPTYNSSDTLRLSLETVLWQDYDDYEVWVVDDGSEDNTPEVVTAIKDERYNYIKLAKNSGSPSVPRNEGLNLSQGKYIAYLGHDDLWFPWHLSRLVQAMESSTSDLVFSLGLTMGPNGVQRGFTLPFRAWRPNQLISPSNWLHKRDLANRVGNWSTKIYTGNDRDFLHRCIKAKAKFNYSPHLSVLKFASHTWRMYDRHGGTPQQTYVNMIRQDPQNTCIELLTQLASHVSRNNQKPLNFKRLKKRIHNNLRLFFLTALSIYGRHRWPANTIMYRRWRRRSGHTHRKR